MIVVHLLRHHLFAEVLPRAHANFSFHPSELSLTTYFEYSDGAGGVSSQTAEGLLAGRRPLSFDLQVRRYQKQTKQ